MKKINYFFRSIVALTLSVTMSFSMASYISLSKQSLGYSQVSAKTKGKRKNKKMGLNTKALTLSLGKTYTLKFYGSKKIKWQSKNHNIATITKKGKIKAKKTGKTKIICTVNNKKYICSLKVVKPKIQLNYKKLILKKKGKIKLKLLNAKGKVIWKSFNKKIVTVNKNGIVYGKKVGRTIIQAKNKKKAYKCKVTVVKIKKSKSTSSNVNNSGADISSNSNNSTSNESNKATENSLTNSNTINDSTKSDNEPISNTENDISKNTNNQNDNSHINTGKSNNDNQNKVTNDEVMPKDEVKVISNDSKEEKSTMKEIHNNIVDFYSSLDSNGNDLMNFVVSNDSPLYQYIINGLYKTGDVIYIEPNKYFVAGLSVKYIGHDDQYQEGMFYNVDSYEVIHTQKASLSDMYRGDLNIKSDSFDQEDPIAFQWTPKIRNQVSTKTIKKARRYGKIIKNTNTLLKQQGANETDEDNGTKPEFLVNFDDAIKFEPNNKDDFNIKKKIKYGIKDLVVYDEDGNLSTKNDQLTLNASKEFKNISPDLNIDWSLPKLPTAFTAKLSYEENTNVNLKFSPDTDGLEDIIKNLNKKVLGDSIDNKININLLGFIKEKISGIDLSDRIILGAVGLNTSGSVNYSYKDIVGESKILKFSPILMFVLLTNK